MPYAPAPRARGATTPARAARVGDAEAPAAGSQAVSSERPGMPLRVAWNVVQETYARWSADDGPRLAASLAFYTMFSLAPLLVVAIAIAGLFLGREAVHGQLVAQIVDLVGRDGASAIEDLIAHASRAGESVVASAIGFLVLLFGASSVVGELKASLNTIWDVPYGGTAVLGFVRERLMSIALVLGIGFVLLVSLVISACLAAASQYLHGDVAAGLWIAVNVAVTLCIESALFALMFKLLPDAHVRWAEVWFGALCTAVLFELGKLLVGLYLGRAGLASAYGAAGSLVVVLVWVYYSAQILFFGAELTRVVAQRRRGDMPVLARP
ncbi:MAG TPA: YihY/virulence factor BrkB family protein [Candidatus Dormibacteraeota bacterium]|nr:YihY/virulence factor BrkB family protein [Candidatus Dormibacteraeota bacterium]